MGVGFLVAFSGEIRSSLTPLAAESEEHVIHVRSLSGSRAAHELLGAEHQSTGLVSQVGGQSVGQLIRVLQRQADLLDLWRHLLDQVRIAQLGNGIAAHRVHRGQGQNPSGQQNQCHFSLHGYCDVWCLSSGDETDRERLRNLFLR